LVSWLAVIASASRVQVKGKEGIWRGKWKGGNTVCAGSRGGSTLYLSVHKDFEPVLDF